MSLSNQIKNDRKGNQIIQKALEAGTPIQKGANANAVRWLERMLKLAGFDAGKLDTMFDGKTEAALKKFQGAWGLPQTGKLDKATFKKLEHTQARIRNTQKHQKGCADCKVDSFGVGQSGAAVRTAEAQLKKLGYDVGKVDGVFDQQTRQAVLAFRKDQKELGNGQGVLTKNALKVLDKESRGLNHVAFQVRAQKDHKPRKRLDALTAAQADKVQADGKRGFTVGAKGRAVINVQKRLVAAGFDPKRTDGVFDERTRGALEAFQRRSGLEATGRVTPQTWKKLSQTFIYAKTGLNPGQQLNERSAAVQRSENLLRKLGYKSVKADGLYDAATRNAVLRFEKKHKLKADGVLTQGDYNKMKKVLASRGAGKVKPGRGWAGSEGMADVAKAVARQMGIPVTSMKRSAAGSIGSSTGSDHHVSQKNAYAVDFGVAGSRGTQMAHRLAKAYNLKPPYIGTYRNHFIKVEGKTYRVQLLWKVQGHYDHVHMGFRRVG
jgi:peptidoglycan hydrolase-like protein with peptidoglycan-binding domain